MDFLKQPVFVNLTSPDYRIFLVRPKYSISWSEGGTDLLRRCHRDQGGLSFCWFRPEARLKIITGQGYMPVDVIGDPVWSDSTIDRIPLVRNGDPVRKTYCAFWRKDNSGYYIEDFSDMLKEAFAWEFYYINRNLSVNKFTRQSIAFILTPHIDHCLCSI